MKRTVLTFGVISGIIAAALMMITVFRIKNSEDYSSGYVWGYTAIILSFLLVFFGIRSYRDNQGGGVISFGKAFSVGILIALISSLFYVITWAFVYHYIVPDYMDRYVEVHVEKLQEEGKSAAEITAETEKMMEFKEMYKNPFMFVLMTFAEPFPVGLVITLISAAILKRKSPKKTVAAT